MKTPGPIKKALRALELKEGLAKLQEARKMKALKERHANYTGELQRLHGQAGMLPGLQQHLAQRRAVAKAIARKINKG
jgi:hypothetical protein